MLCATRGAGTSSGLTAGLKLEGLDAQDEPALELALGLGLRIVVGKGLDVDDWRCHEEQYIRASGRLIGGGPSVRTVPAQLTIVYPGGAVTPGKGPKYIFAYTSSTRR